MKKTNEDYEINLLELLIIIFSNKLKIFLCTLLTLVIMWFYLENRTNPIKTYSAKTTIKPIKFSDEAKYELYNDYIVSMFIEKIETKSLILFNPNGNFKNNGYIKIFNAEILLDLFILELKEKIAFEKAIMKLNIIKKEDYTDDVIYKQAVKNLADKIKIKYLNNTWNIEFKVDNITEWEKLLSYTNFFINETIQDNLLETFKRNVNNQQMFNSFKIEDINNELINHQGNKSLIGKLEQQKFKLENDKTLKRLEEFFYNTPIQSSDFNAAEMKIKSTEYILITEFNTNTKMLILAGLFGILLSIIYVFISHNRNNKIQVK